MRINPFILSFVFLGCSTAFALDFPTGFPKVDQTYGDFNGSMYHEGIDLPGTTSGQYVISNIPNGVFIFASPGIQSPQDYVCIQDPTSQTIYAFGHIKPTVVISTLSYGDIVAQGAVIGELQNFPPTISSARYPHLHVSVTTRTDYKCRNGGAEDPLPHFSPVTQVLTLNTTDIIPVPNLFTSTSTQVLEDKFQEFLVQGVSYTGVYGSIDVIVHAQNNVNGGNRSGVYQLDFSLIDGINNTVLFSSRPFSMYGVMIPTNTSRTTTYLSPPTREAEDGSETDWQNYYNVSNVGQQAASAVQFDSNVVENSWKTADYPDTIYQVKVTAYPYPAGSPPSPVEAVRNIAVDNYRPYAQDIQLLLKSGETEIPMYHVTWATSAVVGSTDTLVPVLISSNPMVPGEYNAVITFSEYVSTTAVWLDDGPTISAEIHDDPSIHKTRLEGTFSLQLQDFPQDAEVQLMLNGVDKAGNGLLGLTASSTTISITNALRRAANGFLPGTASTDSFHTLRIEATQPMITRENSSGILGDACMGTCSTEESPVYFTSNRVRFGYSDLGSGIASVKLYKDAIDPENQIEIPDNTEQNYVFEKTHDLPDGKYVQVVTA